jgi:hypothetical protein
MVELKARASKRKSKRKEEKKKKRTPKDLRPGVYRSRSQAAYSPFLGVCPDEAATEPVTGITPSAALSVWLSECTTAAGKASADDNNQPSVDCDDCEGDEPSEPDEAVEDVRDLVCCCTNTTHMHKRVDVHDFMSPWRGRTHGARLCVRGGLTVVMAEEGGGGGIERRRGGRS